MQIGKLVALALDRLAQIVRHPRVRVHVDQDHARGSYIGYIRIKNPCESD
jgi:hypothetical protein